MKLTDNTTYTQMGMAALLPGMTRILEIVQQHVNELREQLEQLQTTPPATRGRPRKYTKQVLLPAAPAVVFGKPFGGAPTSCPYCHERIGMKAMWMHVNRYHPKNLKNWQTMPKHKKYSVSPEDTKPPSARKPHSRPEATGKQGWPTDPEERRAERARRDEVIKKNAIRARMSEVAKARWLNMTPKQQKARLASMAAAKAAKANGALREVSA